MSRELHKSSRARRGLTQVLAPVGVSCEVLKCLAESLANKKAEPSIINSIIKHLTIHNPLCYNTYNLIKG